LSIRDGEHAVLLKCHAGCDNADVFSAVVDFTGLHKSDFFYKKFFTASGEKPVTVAELAEAKKLPVEFFTACGIRDSPRGVLIPYWDGTTSPRVRLRMALKAGEGSRWDKSTNGKITAYGTWTVPNLAQGRVIYFVEGETDTLTGWYHGLPTLGFPGKATARRILADNPHIISGVDHIFVIEEPDDYKERQFLRQVRRGLTDAHWHGGIFPMRLPEKDLSALHVTRGSDGFWPAFKEAWEAAVDAPSWPDPLPVPVWLATLCGAITSAKFPAEFKVRDVQRCFRAMRSVDIRSALEELEKFKLVRCLKPPRTVGRPAQIYRTNPKARLACGS
jgi:hypothetical protein